MPIIQSAKKRVLVAKKAAIRNSKTKRSLKTALKNFFKKAEPKAQNAAQSAIDTAAKKGVIHKNKAARLKKQLATKAKAEGMKPEATEKKAAKPAAATKPTTEQATAPKKSAAKAEPKSKASK